MMLRAFMISHIGPTRGDPVLDLQEIINLFFDEIPFTYEETLMMVKSRNDIDIQNVKDLRKLKNRLRVIDLLVDSGHLVPSKELSVWLSLREQLP
jgi:hypothetical protein